jgi:hypothetical protein
LMAAERTRDEMFRLAHRSLLCQGHCPILLQFRKPNEL